MREEDGIYLYKGALKGHEPQPEYHAVQVAMKDVLFCPVFSKNAHLKSVVLVVAALKKKAGLSRRGSDKTGEWYFDV